MQTSSSCRSSTSLCSRSSRAHTPSSPASLGPQAELIDLIRAEVDDQTYEFDPDVVARMLSPKLPRTNAKSDLHPALDNFECLIDHPTVQAAIGELPQLEYTGWDLKSEGNNNYVLMAAFLNKCVEQCDVVYDIIHQRMPPDSRFKVAVRSQRWFPGLRFIKCDKPLRDRTRNSHPTKPDIVGVDDSQAVTYNVQDIDFWWGMPPDIQQEGENALRHRLQISIPMEMKDSWSEIVKQSGTYARSQFAVSPLRSFVLVIAANHEKRDLRFLIFHHGGMSASKALKLDKAGCHAVQKMLLSVLLWQCAEDAGLPNFTDGQSFRIHENIINNAVWNISPICHTVSTRGRNTFVVRLESTEGGTKQKPVDKEPDYSVGLRYPSATTPILHSTQASPCRLQTTRGTEKHSSKNISKTSSLSGSSQAQTNVANSIKRSADEAKLDPISYREKKPRHLASVIQSSSMIPSNLNKSTPSVLVVKCSWPNAAREEIEPKMYATCANAFGIPRSLGSYVPCIRDNHPMCNSIFLPRNQDIKKHHWPIFYLGEKPAPSPKEVDCRRLWITVLVDEGGPLDECLDAQDLRNCLLHSMIGWLSAYQNGYLHQDISIGNLLRLVNPVRCERFNALEFIRLVVSSEELGELDLNDETAASRFINEKHPECQELLTVAQQLNKTLSQCGLTNECRAVVIDGDLAAYMPSYFDSDHGARAFSGTIEFMSTQLLQAMEYGESALHSPLDDLWSFFWTALWATLDNYHHPGLTKREKIWRDQLRDRRTARDDVANSIKLNPIIEMKHEYSLILRQMVPLLRQWCDSLERRTYAWARELDEKRDGAGANELLMLFHKFAYIGVLDFVEIASKHNNPVNTSA